MVQCAACGKFMGSKEGVSCPKCKSKSHNECVRVPVGVTVSDTWRCGDCQCKTPKGRDPTTPIRAMQDSYLVQTQTRGEPAAAASEPSTSGQVDVDVVRALREEMRSEFGKIHNLMSSEFKSSKDNMGTFFEEMRDLKREMSATRSCFNERMDSFDTRIVALEQAKDIPSKSEDVSSLQLALTEVKMQLNDREQDFLLNDVVITGLPEQKGENPTHLASLLGTKMGISLDERDIVLVEREGIPRHPRNDSPANRPAAPTRARRVVVRFARRSTRDSYLQAARTRRGLTTTEIGVDGPPVRIYVNERLTRTNGQLFAKVREECRVHMWKYCWTKEGRIYVRKEHGTPYSRIRNEQDITRIFANGSV